MSTVLFYTSGAASMVVHLALLELAVAHELRSVDLGSGEQRTAEYLKLNPNGQVPCLVLNERPMFESAAMLLILADRNPASGLSPSAEQPEREVFLAWLFHLSNTVQPAFQAWFNPNAWAGAEHADVVKESARSRIEAAFERLNAHLASSGGTLTGQYSVADMLAVMLMRWSRNMPKPATEWAHLNALAQQVRARPAWRELYLREGLSEWA